ncbi:MAG: acylneuraminate cytidylyltransferase [Chloroflexi bacterium]|nr:acylneuraminate cytidylyltransferase [Chloroflexota bacterium]|tara:strand:- start:10349 stop:11101 length:753 start_codon:yes stop_codon:yes gene_type:complete
MIGCIIQARMGSSRLPGKVMMKLDNSQPILYYVIKQHQFCNLVDKIVVATTELESDDIIAEFTHNMEVDCFRGNSTNVLDRYYQCAKKYNFSIIIRVTADNPFNDPQVVDKVVEEFKSKDYDYITNSLPRTFPQGISVEIFSFDVLEKAWNNAKLPSEKEHVTPYIYNHPDDFKISNFRYEKDFSNIRCTVDRDNDYKLTKIIASEIKKSPILVSDILNLFKEKPELFEINKDHILDEGYKISLEEDKVS